MANTRAPSTIITVPLTGQVDFTIPFEYLARKYVELTLLGTVRQPLTLNVDYRFVSKTMVSLTVVPGANFNKLEIRRVTSATERLVDFHDGSILRAYDLNLSQIQTLHVAEEARDLTADTIGVNDEGNLDARGRRIVNVADAVDGRDAVTLGQVILWNESALNSANRAQVSQELAQTSANNAHDYKNLAASFATNAEISASTALTAQASASASATTANDYKNQAAASASASEGSNQSSLGAEQRAVAQANRATTEADRAEREANKLQDWNELAGLVHVNPTTINFDRGLAITPNATDTGLTVEAVDKDWVGVRIHSDNVRYGMVRVGSNMEEHTGLLGASGSSLIRRIESNGLQQNMGHVENYGSTRHVGAVESCLSVTGFRRSISYNPGSDSITEYNYTTSYSVINAAGERIGGRAGAASKVGYAVDFGTNPNVEYTARLTAAGGDERGPMKLTKPNMNSQAPVEMTLPAVINRSNWGNHSGSENVWVQHHDDGYLEQGGIILVVTNASPVAVPFPVAADEVWNIQITPYTEGARGGQAEANSTIVVYNGNGFQLHSGQSKDPCRFFWSMKGKRFTPA